MKRKWSIREIIAIFVIIFIVLGMVLLMNLWDEAKKTEARNEVKEQILEDLNCCNVNQFSFDTEIKIENGKEMVKNLSFVNSGEDSRTFHIKFELFKGQRPNGDSIDNVTMEKEISFGYNNNNFTLSSGESVTIPLNISAASSASGNYLCRVIVCDNVSSCDIQSDGSISAYEARSFFVKVE